MDLVNTKEGQLRVEWSEYASVEFDGRWYSAFQRNSYVARVTFPSGDIVIVALPPGAAHERTDYWVKQTVEAAMEARENGSGVVLS